MKKLIGISGRKQSGKNTAANFIHGQVLKQLNMIHGFVIDKYGSLVIETSDNEGNKGLGIFDITRKDIDYVTYAEKYLWPHIKLYHFADILKELSISLFGLTYNQVYGTDADKNTYTNILWENFPGNKKRSGQMTAREFLQHFGTDIVRKIESNAWTHSTIKRIVQEDPNIAVISDVRFPNEVEEIQNNGGIVIRLTRTIEKSQHDSEKQLDRENYDWKKFNFIIDNDNGSIDDLCEQLENISFIWSNI
jgi:hypothetical protein